MKTPRNTGNAKHLKHETHPSLKWQVKVIRVENDRAEVMYNYKIKQEVASCEERVGSDLFICSVFTVVSRTSDSCESGNTLSLFYILTEPNLL